MTPEEIYELAKTVSSDELLRKLEIEEFKKVMTPLTIEWTFVQKPDGPLSFFLQHSIGPVYIRANTGFLDVIGNVRIAYSDHEVTGDFYRVGLSRDRVYVSGVERKRAPMGINNLLNRII